MGDNFVRHFAAGEGDPPSKTHGPGAKGGGKGGKGSWGGGGKGKGSWGEDSD